MTPISVVVVGHQFAREDKDGTIVIAVNIQPDGPGGGQFASMPGSATFHMLQDEASKLPIGAKFDLTLTPKAK